MTATALVTGGSRGIGAAIVRRLAADGVRVVFTYRSDTDAAARVAAEAPGSRAVRADQSDMDSVDTMLDAAGGAPDILVLNAAVNTPKPIADLTAADFDHVMTVNAKVPLLVIARAAPAMPDGGRIIAVSTLNTALPAPGAALYSASKAALEQFVRVASRELGPRGITVNTVSPGATDTDMLRAANPPEALEVARSFTALGRLGRPSDIAAVVAFLAGPDAAWITGQNILATGGALI